MKTQTGLLKGVAVAGIAVMAIAMTGCSDGSVAAAPDIVDSAVAPAVPHGNIPDAVTPLVEPAPQVAEAPPADEGDQAVQVADGQDQEGADDSGASRGPVVTWPDKFPWLGKFPTKPSKQPSAGTPVETAAPLEEVVLLSGAMVEVGIKAIFEDTLREDQDEVCLYFLSEDPRDSSVDTLNRHNLIKGWACLTGADIRDSSNMVGTTVNGNTQTNLADIRFVKIVKIRQTSSPILMFSYVRVISGDTVLEYSQEDQQLPRFKVVKFEE